MDKILFLDFDGVLKFSVSSLGESHNSVVLLENFLRKNDDVKVVFSTDWRKNIPFQELLLLFKHDVRKSFINVTPTIPQVENGQREAEIRSFLRSNYKENYKDKVFWIAIDDRANIFTPNYQNLYLVDNFDPFINDKDIQKIQQHFDNLSLPKPNK